MNAQIKTPAQVAALFGCSVDQARSHMLENAAQLRKLATGTRDNLKARGYTRDELLIKAEQFETAVNL
jgi:hypothetical protein